MKKPCQRVQRSIYNEDMTNACNDFLVVSYPRSGNTLTRLVLQHCFGIPQLSPIEEDVDNPLKKTTRELHLGSSKDSEYVGYKVHAHGSNLYKAYPDCPPSIIIIRDCRDAFISGVHYRKDIQYIEDSDGIEELFKKLCDNTLNHLYESGFTDAGDWSDFYKFWVYTYQSPKVFIKYEDLIHSPIKTVRYSLEYLFKTSFDLINQDLPSFEAFHDVEPAFFRKGTVGSWKEEVSQETGAYAYKQHEEMMRFFGYVP